VQILSSFAMSVPHHTADTDASDLASSGDASSRLVASPRGKTNFTTWNFRSSVLRVYTISARSGDARAD
jgi:hypothetical protein